MAIRSKHSVSLPPDLAGRVQEAARRRGITFSGWLAETAERQLKIEAGLSAVEAWEREHGPFSERELAEAQEWTDRLLRGESALQERPYH